MDVTSSCITPVSPHKKNQIHAFIVSLKRFSKLAVCACGKSIIYHNPPLVNIPVSVEKISEVRDKSCNLQVLLQGFSRCTGKSKMASFVLMSEGGSSDVKYGDCLGMMKNSKETKTCKLETIKRRKYGRHVLYEISNAKKQQLQQQ